MRELWDRADFPRHTMKFKVTEVDDPEQKEFVLEQNALHVACEGGFADVARFLMKKGIRPCTVDSLGRSSLLIACEYAHFECAELVIAPDLAWSEKPDNNGRTPFILACNSSNAGLVKLLYRRGVDIHKPAPLIIRCPSGKTSCKIAFNPLAAAVISGSSEVVSCLLQLGVTDKTPSKCLSCISECPSGFDGLTPLQLAEKVGDDCIRRKVAADTKRQRRETPVKLRAEKSGVCLPPTPAGVRVASRWGVRANKKSCCEKTAYTHARILVLRFQITIMRSEPPSPKNLIAAAKQAATAAMHGAMGTQNRPNASRMGKANLSWLETRDLVGGTLTKGESADARACSHR